MKDRSPENPKQRNAASQASVRTAERRSFCSALVAAGFSVSLSFSCVESSVQGPTLSGSEPLEIHAEYSGMPISVALDGDSVVRGENAFLVRLSDAGATLTAASAVMPGHGHDTASPSIERRGSEYRVTGLLLFMPGRWEVTLELDVAGMSDQAIFRVDVP